MRAFRRNPGPMAALMILALTLVGIGGWGQLQWREMKASQRQADMKYREWQMLAKTVPQLTEATADRIAADVARLEEVRAKLRTDLLGQADTRRRMDDAPVSLNRTEAFFELATFFEKTRARAQELGVVINPDERFGFADYAHSGPRTELIPAVLRQRMMVEYLLDALFAAQPRRLIAVERESLEAAPSGLSGAGSDYMTVRPSRSLRVPGLIKATGYRLKFTGHTATLRAFLNRLGTFDPPVVVRAVEVEPVWAGQGPDKASPAVLVAQPITEFTVTVESIELETEGGPQT